MSIATPAIIFVIACIPIALYGLLFDREPRKDPQPDYLSIYQAINPKEL